MVADESRRQKRGRYEGGGDIRRKEKRKRETATSSGRDGDGGVSGLFQPRALRLLTARSSAVVLPAAGQVLENIMPRICSRRLRAILNRLS